MTFIKEVGAILDHQGSLISMFDGEPGYVDFPNEMIAKLHQMSPGNISRLTHVHPPGFSSLSVQDKKMMKNLAFVMHPFPVRLGVISENFDGFKEKIFVCMLEPKELWKKRGGDRNVYFEEEFETFGADEWPAIKTLINRAYGK